MHTDQGAQYVGAQYQGLVRQSAMVSSISRRGNAWDNAPMESFYARKRISSAIGYYTQREVAYVIGIEARPAT